MFCRDTELTCVLPWYRVDVCVLPWYRVDVCVLPWYRVDVCVLPWYRVDVCVLPWYRVDVCVLPWYRVDVCVLQDWTLPSEAFQPRHELTAHATPPDLESSHDDLMTQTNNGDFTSHPAPSESEDQDLLVQVKPATCASWTVDFSHRIANMLKAFAEQVTVTLETFLKNYIVLFYEMS